MGAQLGRASLDFCIAGVYVVEVNTRDRSQKAPGKKAVACALALGVSSVLAIPVAAQTVRAPSSPSAGVPLPPAPPAPPAASVSSVPSSGPGSAPSSSSAPAPGLPPAPPPAANWHPTPAPSYPPYGYPPPAAPYPPYGYPPPASSYPAYGYPPSAPGYPPGWYGYPPPGWAPVAEHPKPKKVWYGWQTLLTDGVAVVVGALAYSGGSHSDSGTTMLLVGPGMMSAMRMSDDNSSISGSVYIGGALYALGAPTIHVAHGRPGVALGSLALRTLPLLIMTSACDSGDIGDCLAGLLLAFSSFPAAVALDASVFSRYTEDPPRPPGVRSLLDGLRVGAVPRPGGGVLVVGFQ